MAVKCPHGFEVGVYRGYTGAMAAPFDFCECCKTNFYYIDSGNMTIGRDGANRWENWNHDKGLCPDCGGGTTHTVHENGKTLIKERVGA